MRLVAIVAGVVVALDQASKYVVVHLLHLDLRRAIDVWPPYLNLRMAWNDGVNFGLFGNEAALVRWGLVAVALAISAWIWRWIAQGRHPPLVRAAAGLVIGGALGNALDRVIYGAVADFLNMSCCGIRNPFAFNGADVAIFAGALGLVLLAGRAKTA